MEIKSEEWEDKFLPIMDGESYKDFHPKIINDADRVILKEAINENRVWTLVDGDDGELYLINGLRLVNRIDVYITEKPYDRDYEIYWND